MDRYPHVLADSHWFDHLCGLMLPSESRPHAIPNDSRIPKTNLQMTRENDLRHMKTDLKVFVVVILLWV